MALGLVATVLAVVVTATVLGAAFVVFGRWL
jgi:hypothetical protein